MPCVPRRRGRLSTQEELRAGRALAVAHRGPADGRAGRRRRKRLPREQAPRPRGGVLYDSAKSALAKTSVPARLRARSRLRRQAAGQRRVAGGVRGRADVRSAPAVDASAVTPALPASPAGHQPRRCLLLHDRPAVAGRRRRPMSTTTEAIRNGVDTEQLFGTLDAIKADTSLARFQFRARGTAGSTERTTVRQSATSTPPTRRTHRGPRSS